MSNLAMWLLNTLETSRTDAHPMMVLHLTWTVELHLVYKSLYIECFQVEFYGGSWAWPMISHISMPLAIFYRYLAFLLLEVPHPHDGIFIAHALPQ